MKGRNKMIINKNDLEYFEGGVTRTTDIFGTSFSAAVDGGGYLELLVDKLVAQNVHVDIELKDMNGAVVASKKGKDASFAEGIFVYVKNEAGSFSIDNNTLNILEVTGDSPTLGAGSSIVLRISGKIDGAIYRVRYGFGFGAQAIDGGTISGNGVFELIVPFDYSAG